MKVMDELSEKYKYEANSVIFISNKTLTHGRGQFNPLEARHLKRIYIKQRDSQKSDL